MKTTVKNFILNNLTDKNFEILVNTLVKEKIWSYFIDDELYDAATKYLDNQKPSYAEDNTFKILNEIKNVSEHSIMDYTGHFFDYDLTTLNDTSTSWMPSETTLEETQKKMDYAVRTKSKNLPYSFSGDELEVELDDLPSDEKDYDKGDERRNANSEYMMIQDIKIALIPDGYEYSDNDLSKMTLENHKELINKEKIQTALGLANFIYEVWQYSNESKLGNIFEEFSDITSHVKISNDHQYMDGYGVLLYLDNRSRYVSSEKREKYSQWQYSLIEEDEVHYYNPSAFEFPIVSPDFVEYTLLVDYLSDGSAEYILAPFTFYLNEDLFMPDVSDETLYNILEQLIHILTSQGFTKREQVNTNIFLNEQYLWIHML